MKYEQNRFYYGGGVVYVLKVRYLNQHDSTVRMIEIAHFSVGKLLLHHYSSDLAHISDFDSLVIGISKSER